MGTTITSPGLTVEDLGQKVKAKYPGQYDDLPDIVVGQRVKRKYSQDYGDFRDLSPHEVAMKTRAAQDAQIPEEPSQVNNFVSTLGGDIYKGLSAIPGALRHPIDTYNNIFDGIVSAGIDQGKQAISAFKSGELSRAAGHALAALPGFAPAANAGEEFASGDTGAGAAHTLELLGPSVAKYGARVLAPAMRNTTLGRIASNPEVRQSVMDAIPGGGKVLKAAQTIRKAARAPAEIPTPLSGPEEFESLKPVVKAPLPENAPIGARTPVIRNAPAWESIPNSSPVAPPIVEPVPSTLPSGRKVGPAPAPEPVPARAPRIPLWQRSPGAQVLPPPEGIAASPGMESEAVETSKLAKTAPKNPEVLPAEDDGSSLANFNLYEDMPTKSTRAVENAPWVDYGIDFGDPIIPKRGSITGVKGRSKSSAQIIDINPSSESPGSQILSSPQIGEHAFEAPEGNYIAKEHYLQRSRTAKARGVAKWLQDKSPEEVQKLTPKEWDSHASDAGYSKMSPESRAIAIEEHQKLYAAKNPK